MLHVGSSSYASQASNGSTIKNTSGEFNGALALRAFQTLFESGHLVFKGSRVFAYLGLSSLLGASTHDAVTSKVSNALEDLKTDSLRDFNNEVLGSIFDSYKMALSSLIISFNMSIEHQAASLDRLKGQIREFIQLHQMFYIQDTYLDFDFEVIQAQFANDFPEEYSTALLAMIDSYENSLGRVAVSGLGFPSGLLNQSHILMANRRIALLSLSDSVSKDNFHFARETYSGPPEDGEGQSDCDMIHVLQDIYLKKYGYRVGYPESFKGILKDGMGVGTATFLPVLDHVGRQKCQLYLKRTGPQSYEMNIVSIGIRDHERLELMNYRMRALGMIDSDTHTKYTLDGFRNKTTSGQMDRIMSDELNHGMVTEKNCTDLAYAEPGHARGQQPFDRCQKVFGKTSGVDSKKYRSLRETLKKAVEESTGSGF